MSSRLRDVMSLPEGRQAEMSAQADEFHRAFLAGVSRLNWAMQTAAPLAPPEELQPLVAQRMQLYEAFHKASQRIEPDDPAAAEPAIERVLAALQSLESKASALARDVCERRDAWLKRESEFDDARVRISELQRGGHPKAAALDQLSEGIRSRVNVGNYDESIAVLDQLRPKLDQIYSEYLHASPPLRNLRQQVAAEEVAYQSDVEAILQAHPRPEVNQSVSGLVDNQWSTIDGLGHAVSTVAPGGMAPGAGLPAELERDARGVGVDLLMRAARKVVKNREAIRQASAQMESHADSDLMKLLTFGNPLTEPARQLALRMARAGAETPEIAEQILKHEKDIRALAAMDSRQATESSLKNLDQGETFETELHGTVEVHAKAGGKVGAQVSSKAKKLKDDEYEVEIQIGAKVMVGVGASGQGQGAAADVGVGSGGKLVVKVKGDSPEAARAQVATLMQMANGDNAAMQHIAQLNGVTVKEAKGKAAAIFSAGASVVGTELKGEVVQDYKVIGDDPGEAHVGVAGRLVVKAEASGPVTITVPDDLAEMGDLPSVKKLDPRLQALLGEMPVDVARQLEEAYGATGGLKLGAEVQVEAHLYAPADVGAPLLVQGGVVAYANRLELSYKGKLEAGNTNVELTHQVVVKDLQGLSKEFKMSPDQLAAAMQDGTITRDEIASMIPDAEARDKYIDFNSKAEIEHFDGIKIDALGFGGHIGESNKMTLYEVKDGKMVEKCDDIGAEFDKMEDKTDFDLPVPEPPEEADGGESSWTQWLSDPGKKLDELKDDAERKYDELKDDAVETYEKYKEKVEDKYEEYKDKAEEKYEEYKDQAEEKYDEYKDKAEEKYEEYKDKAEAKYEEVKDDVAEKYEETKEDIKETIDDAKEIASDPLGFMKDKLL